MQFAGSIGASGFEMNFSPTHSISYKHESGSLMYLSQQVAARTVVFSVQHVNSHFSVEHFFFSLVVRLQCYFRTGHLILVRLLTFVVDNLLNGWKL